MNKKLIALSAVSMAAMASAAVNLEIWFDGTNQQVNTGGLHVRIPGLRRNHYGLLVRL